MQNNLKIYLSNKSVDVELIYKEKAVKRLQKGKQVFGLAESHYLDDEWVDLTNSCKEELTTYYRIFAKPTKSK